jgi:hypothetical protein
MRFDLEPQVIEVDCKIFKSTLRAIVPRGDRMMVFDLNPFKPVTL